VGRHAASNDSTVSPPRLNPRALRDLHSLTSSSLDAAPLGAAPLEATPLESARITAEPINAADLIARFRESGLLSEVTHRTAGPPAIATVNAPAPLPLDKMPQLDRAVALKAAAPELTSDNRLSVKADHATDDAVNATDDPASEASAPVRVADLLNRHPDIASRSPRTGHRAQSQRPTRSGGRLSALRPPPSIRVAVRPALTVAAIITAFALVEAPNLRAIAHASPSSHASHAQATGSTATESSSDPGADSVSMPADLPRHGPAITPGSGITPGTPSRVSRSTRRSIGPVAHQVPLLKPGQTVAGTWIRPSSGRYTSCFCGRWGSFHAGIDLASKLGTPILAVGDGTVVKAGPASGFGNWVVIEHSNGDVSIYGHMKYFFVHAGQKVKAGEKIAVVGDQGFSTGPHLHFEVHKGGLGGTKINPIPWLKARGIVIGPLSKDG
jgi:murein DD-endopeptidase MepM/ murein hydrolase activator NlpD